MDMDNLEKYIREHRDAFDGQDLPEGHLGRFEAKLARKPVRRMAWVLAAVTAVATTAAAAAIAGIIFLNRPVETHHDWFAGIGNNEYDICNTYYDKVAEYYEVMMRKCPDADILNTIDMIVGETIPMVNQLPEEMDPDAKAAVLKEYYGDLLAGLERVASLN